MSYDYAQPLAPQQPAREAEPAEEVVTRRDQLGNPVQEDKFYCPACGQRGGYPQKCSGPAGGYGHFPVEMVSTDELRGPAEGHTAAPATG